MVKRLLSFFYLLPQLWRALSQDRDQVDIKSRKVKISPYFRGKPELNPELCRGCGLCERDCPAFALELERENRDRYRLILYQDRCAYCGQCEASCSFKAIKLGNEISTGAADKEEFKEILVDRISDLPKQNNNK